MNWNKFKAALLKALIGGSGFAALLYAEYVLDVHKTLNEGLLQGIVTAQTYAPGLLGGGQESTDGVSIIDSFVCAAKLLFGGAC